jgi:hypothetical protein
VLDGGEALERAAQAQLAGEMQRDQAVGVGPEDVRDGERVALEQAGGHRLGHGVVERAEGPGALPRQLRRRGPLGLAQLEHDAVGVGLVDGEAHVRLLEPAQARERVAAAAGEGGLEPVGEAAERLGAHQREQLLLAREVAVGRHGAHAQRGGHGAHGDRVVPLLGEEVHGRIGRAAAEGGDLVGLAGGAGHDERYTA